MGLSSNVAHYEKSHLQYGGNGMLIMVGVSKVDENLAQKLGKQCFETREG